MSGRAESCPGSEGPNRLQAAASELYLQHHDEVYRYVRARVGSRPDAEDLTADVFCRAVGALGRYRQMRSSALPWLYTIAGHRVADFYRRARPCQRIDLASQVADPGAGPLERAMARGMVRRVWEASEGLPSAQRRALWLRYGEDLDLREISLRMGRSVEATKLLIHRAVQGVRLAIAGSVGRAHTQRAARLRGRRRSAVAAPGRVPALAI